MGSIYGTAYNTLPIYLLGCNFGAFSIMIHLFLSRPLPSYVVSSRANVLEHDQLSICAVT